MSSIERIYVASSWRNGYQPYVVQELRRVGYDAYDFRNPEPGDHGFHWSEVDPDWQAWTPHQYRAALDHPIAIRGFTNDFQAMMNADACVLVLPSGRSAHLEAGYFVGIGKPLFILLLDKQEPELMYKMASAICLTMSGLFVALAGTR